MPAEVIKVKKKVSASALARAAHVLKKGGVAVLPSDTVYALASSVKFPKSVSRVAKIKGRRGSQVFSIFVSGWRGLLRHSKNRPGYFRKLKPLLPGPYTFVLPARGGLPKLCVSKGKVGLRWPRFALLKRLVKNAGSPLVATSANRSGKAPFRSGRAALREFQNEVDLILDGGALPLGEVSTVAEFNRTEAVVWRKGAGYKKLVRRLEKLGVRIRHGR